MITQKIKGLGIKKDILKYCKENAKTLLMQI